MNNEDLNNMRISRKKPEIEDGKIPQYTYLEYKQQMMASIRLYKYLSLSVKKNIRTPPFLFRNLLYVDCEKKKVPQFILGVDEPPLAFKRYLTIRKVLPSEKKRFRLEKYVEILRICATKKITGSNRNKEDSDNTLTEKSFRNEQNRNDQPEPCYLQAKIKPVKLSSVDRCPSVKRSKFYSDHEEVSNENFENIMETKFSKKFSKVKSRRAIKPTMGTLSHSSSKKSISLTKMRKSSEKKQKDTDVTFFRKTPSMNQNSGTHNRDDSRYTHPFDLKTRRGKRHYRLSVYSYLGKHQKEDGVYVNASKYMKDYFGRKFLNRKDSPGVLKKLFPIYCPKQLNYRLVGVDAEAKHDKESYNRNSKKYTERHFLDSEEKEWLIFSRTESARKCIICQRSFATLYSLLFHYNANYPRLKFTLFLPKIADHIHNRTQIDVSLNPYNHEGLENTASFAMEMHVPRQPFFLVTQYYRLLLKSEVYMDLTIFTESLATTDVTPTFPTSRLIICTRTGLPGGPTHCEEHPNHIPDRSFEFLTNYLNRSILEFTDVDDSSKAYMCYWNDLGYIMGRELQTKLGLYFRLRIFINKYRKSILSDNLHVPFFCHMKHLVDKNFIDWSLAYDIIMRFYDGNYYPLNDPSSRISRILVEYTEKMRSRYVKSLTNPNKKIIRMKRKVLLRFNEHYHRKTWSLSLEERKELFKFILNKTKFGKTLSEKKWRHLLPLLPLEEIAYKFPEDMWRICRLALLKWTAIPETQISSL